MKLNLIYGRSGSGKSQYLYEDIKKRISLKNESKEKDENEIGTNSIYFIVPEQSNLSAERKLFEFTGKNTLMNVEVITLSRMATRVINFLR